MVVLPAVTRHSGATISHQEQGRSRPRGERDDVGSRTKGIKKRGQLKDRKIVFHCMPP